MPAIIVDPELLASVTRQFQLRGELQPFNLTENVVPIFDIGRLLALSPQAVVTPDLLTMVAAGLSAAARHYAAAPPDSTAGNVSNGQTGPAAGTVLADSGQLVAGQHHCVGDITYLDATGDGFLLEHRNAANAANIETWEFLVALGQPISVDLTITFATDERLRWVVGGVNAVGLVNSNVAAVPSALDIAV